MKSKIIDLASSNTEVILDSLLENGLLKDIPFIGNIIKTLQLKGDISNYLFAKKLEAFVSKLNDNNIVEIDSQLIDKKRLQAIGAELVFIVEKANNIDKSVWIAQAVIGLVENKYGVDLFQRLIYVIDNFSPPLKKCLASHYEKHDLKPGFGVVYSFDSDHEEELANLGLLKRRFEAKISNDGYMPVKYEACNLGRQLWHVITNA